MPKTFDTVSVRYDPVRKINERDIRSFGLQRLSEANAALRFHVPARSSPVDLADIESALSEIAEATDSNVTRCADALLTLAEAVHSLRNAYIRRQSSFGNKRFDVMVGVIDVLYYAQADDDIVFNLVASTIVESLNLTSVPALFNLFHALRDVREFSHSAVIIQ